MYRKHYSGTEDSPLRKIKALGNQANDNRTYVDVSDAVAGKYAQIRRQFGGTDAEFNRLIFTFGLDDLERLLKVRNAAIQR